MEKLNRFPSTVQTKRFILREIELKDVTTKYLAWLSEDQAKKWIVASPTTKQLCDLKSYVFKRINRADVLFLGIFDKLSGSHIGNIKYEPVRFSNSSAELGVLIGDPAFRGKGVFSEVLIASAAWLKEEHGISRIHLGVNMHNLSAIKAYRRAGFVNDPTTQAIADPEVVMMVLHI
jgi:ribosomal-protein-alanine N-acetyltransferase